MTLWLAVPALATLGAAWCGTRRREPWDPVSGDALAAAATALGYGAVHVAVLGLPALPSADREVPARDWILWLVAAAAALAPLRAIPQFQPLAARAYVALFSVLTPRLMRVEAPAGAIPLAAAFGGVVLLFAAWSAAERLAARRAGPAVPLALTIAGGGVAAAALANASITLAIQAGAAAAALLGALVFARLRPDAHLSGGTVGIAAIVFGGVIAVARTYDLPLACVLLLAAAFVAPWIAQAGPFAPPAGRSPAARMACAAALPAAAAVALAWWARA